MSIIPNDDEPQNWRELAEACLADMERYAGDETSARMMVSYKGYRERLELLAQAPGLERSESNGVTEGSQPHTVDATGWRDIKTDPPLEGARVLLLAGDFVFTGFVSDGEAAATGSPFGATLWDASRWQPLPPPPGEDGETYADTVAINSLTLEIEQRREEMRTLQALAGPCRECDWLLAELLGEVPEHVLLKEKFYSAYQPYRPWREMGVSHDFCVMERAECERTDRVIFRPKRYTASLDAVVDLVEREIPGWNMTVWKFNAGPESGRTHVSLSKLPIFDGYSDASHTLPAVALLLALLEAKEIGDE